MKDSVTYTRQATPDAEKVEEQLNLCREFAEQNDFHILEHFVETNRSGKPDRPFLTKMVNSLRTRGIISKEKNFTVLVVSFASLTRSYEDLMKLREQWRQDCIEIQVVSKTKK